MSERIRRRVVVHGLVQGVFFRASTRDEAVRLGLDGWVRNLADGGVEAAFEGPPDAVSEAVRWMGHGPERSVVQAIETFEEDPERTVGFGVRHS